MGGCEYGEVMMRWMCLLLVIVMLVLSVFFEVVGLVGEMFVGFVLLYGVMVDVVDNVFVVVDVLLYFLCMFIVCVVFDEGMDVLYYVGLVVVIWDVVYVMGELVDFFMFK